MLPGKCAFASVDAAAAACNASSACRSIIVYPNDTDGCSPPVALLEAAADPLTEFVSPLVATLTRTDPRGGSGGGAGAPPAPSDGEGGGGLSGGAIAGITVGAVLAAASLALAGWLLRRRRNQRRSQRGSTGAVKDVSGAMLAHGPLLHADEAGVCSVSGTITIPGSAPECQSSGSVPRLATPSGGGSTQQHSGSGGGGLPGIPASSSSGGGGSREEVPLPELLQHIAACEAEQLNVSRGSWGGHGAVQPSLLVASSLSQALQDWIVDISEVTLMRRPDGSLQELGRGASSIVYKGWFRGEVVACKDVDLGRSTSAQKAFVLEAERLHSLRHAHIVALYGVALSGPRGILLMEFRGGRDLMKALELKPAAPRSACSAGTGVDGA